MRLLIADTHDIPALVQFAVSFRNSLQRTEPTEQAFQSGIYHLMDSPDAEFIMIKNDENQPCGYMLLRYSYSMWIPGLEARIEDLYVSDVYRGNGYGKKLVAFAIERAKEKQCQSIYLDTNEKNEASNQIYLSFGFNCESRRWDGGRQIFYRKNLT